MSERLAIYFAPARHSVLDLAATRWLARPDLSSLTLSARRYGFHATIKAPMALKKGVKEQEVASDLRRWCGTHGPIGIGRVEVRQIDGFLALVPVNQTEDLTNFASLVVEEFDRYRAPLDPKDRAKRLQAPLTDRQVKLLDKYGYPFVFEQFKFHMTLTDRLPPAKAPGLIADARAYFAQAIAEPLILDRLVLFREKESGGFFIRGEEFALEGAS